MLGLGEIAQPAVLPQRGKGALAVGVALQVVDGVEDLLAAALVITAVFLFPKKT